MIKITFPDGAVREFESGVTTFEIAQSISNSLAKKKPWLVNSTANSSTRLVLSLKMEASKSWHLITKMPFRSCVTQLPLFAQAARRLFPDIHLGVGPAIEDGFYYDTDNQAGQISNEDLPRIEEEMQKNRQRKTSHQSVKKWRKTRHVKSSKRPLQVGIDWRTLWGRRRFDYLPSGWIWDLCRGLTFHQQAVSKSSTFFM